MKAMKVKLTLNFILGLVLLGLSLIYMIGSLAASKSASSGLPVQLEINEKEIMLDVWKSANLMIDDSLQKCIFDIRNKSKFSLYHLPDSKNMSKSDVIKSQKICSKNILVAALDEECKKTASKLNNIHKGKKTYCVTGGAGAWYIATMLPVPLFTKKSAPFGYVHAVNVVRNYFYKNSGSAKDVKNAIKKLVSLNYQPDLQDNKKKKSAGKKRKKIAGGCG